MRRTQLRLPREYIFNTIKAYSLGKNLNLSSTTPCNFLYHKTASSHIKGRKTRTLVSLAKTVIYVRWASAVSTRTNSTSYSRTGRFP